MMVVFEGASLRPKIAASFSFSIGWARVSCPRSCKSTRLETVRHVSIGDTKRLAEEGIEPSAGNVDDS